MGQPEKSGRRFFRGLFLTEAHAHPISRHPECSEGPLYWLSSTPPQNLSARPLSSYPPQNLSSRPKRSEVERPLYWLSSVAAQLQVPRGFSLGSHRPTRKWALAPGVGSPFFAQNLSFGKALILLVLFAFATSAHAKTKTPTPETRIPLETLGFPGASTSALNQGTSVLTVNFVDSDHLLVTYSLRGLLPRLAGDPADDQDRMVAALLIELPSGKVLARTEWRLHDYAHYLWPLGEGRFLLRIQESLSTFAPLANLSSGRSFARTSFPAHPGVLQAIMVSSDQGLVTVETGHSQPHTDPAAALKAQAAAAVYAARPHFSTNAAEAPPPPPLISIPENTVQTTQVHIDFFRITGPGTLESPITAQQVGALLSPSILALPIDIDGYLRTLGQSHGGWQIAFHPYNSKEIPLARLDTSCNPHVQRVSPSQLVSLNCRGISGGVTLVAYDFAQHDIWEDPLPPSVEPPIFTLAPAAGRFALTRVDTIEGQLSAQGVPDVTTTEEFRVYQTQTGDLLLKIDCNPVYRSEENSDLSPDGMRAAVVRNGNIEIYHLPELTRLDREDLAEMQKLAPPPNPGPIDLNKIFGSSQATTDTASIAAQPTTVTPLGDTPTARPRPTLLNPGEKPEFQDKNSPTH